MLDLCAVHNRAMLSGMHAAGRYRLLMSSVYGDGDGLEVSVSVFLEDILPIKIPKMYFADIRFQQVR